jgi:hypothetical protein
MSDEIANNFCSACGNEVMSTAVICPKCGSPTPKFRSGKSNQGKSKSTAVILAVFFGPWSWLYTYQLNMVKFWISVGGMFGVWLLEMLLIVSLARSGSGAIVGFLVIFVNYLYLSFCWIWSIIYNSIRPTSAYERM